jgi:hypothetical protein
MQLARRTPIGPGLATASQGGRALISFDLASLESPGREHLPIRP